MELLSTYIPIDRRQAIAKSGELPDRTAGTALFADVSGFTPLTEAFLRELGPKEGAEELTRQLNLIYDTLIAKVDRYGGSVTSFGGDAMTCWFDGDDGLKAIACALDMQRAMSRFASVRTPSGGIVSLAMKAALAAGPVRRFLVGDPAIQIMDVLAGATLDRMEAAAKQARRGEVVAEAGIVETLGDKVEAAEWRGEPESGQRFAVITTLKQPVKATPWPVLPAAAQAGGANAPLSDERLRPWFLLKVYEGLKHGKGQFLAEIRPTVALFLNFAGIDYDADAAGGQLDAFVRWVQSILGRYEGYLLQLIMGDKGSYLYSAFGALLAHDDDPARAVAAALDLRQPPPELGFIRGIQIGISQGPMWAGAYGGSTRRTYGVLGDEVNVAARLMSKAAPGEILVGQRILYATAQDYDFRPMGLVQVKGKQEAVPIALVLGRRSLSQQKPFSQFTTPLIGRETELAQLEEMLESALGGEGRVLRIEGGPGVGKSHLTAEFANRAEQRNFRVTTGLCHSINQNLSYSPWRQIFRSLLALTDEPGSASASGEDLAALTARHVAQLERLIDQINPAWSIRLPLLSDLLDLPIPDNAITATFDRRLRQEALFALAVELIQAWSQTQPLLLVIEDAEWLDEASLGLTLALGRAIARHRVVLTLVHRPPVQMDKALFPDLDRLPYHRRLNLSELSPEGVAALVAHRLQGRPSALVLALIQAQAQGNAFFTEELVDALRESGGLGQREDGTWVLSEALINTLQDAHCLVRVHGEADPWRLAPNARLSAVKLDLPDSVWGVVLSRLDRLPEGHKLTLKVSSVIGRIFEFDLLEQAHPEQPGPALLMEQIETLESRDFTRLEIPPPRTAYIFKHNITQEVTYGALLETQQRELHRRVGAALEHLQPDVVEQLAYHYSRGKLRDKTLFYLDKAAHKAQREYANETALNYYTQALMLEERWEWRKGQVEVLHTLGRREEERAALQDLEADPDAPPFEAAYLWGQYHEAIGDYPQAQDAFEQALAVAREQRNEIGEVHCLAQLGLIARRQGDYESAKIWYEQALALFPDREVDTEDKAQALAQALTGLGVVHRQQGKFEEAKGDYEQALRLSRASNNRKGEADALDSLGTVAFHQRNFAEAVHYHQQALEIRRTIGDRTGEGTSLYNLAAATRDTGDYGQAAEHYSASLAIQQAAGNRWEESNIWMGLGVMYQELGDLPQARSCLEQGLRLSEEIGDVAGQAYVLANLGLAVREADDLEGAEKLLTEGLALAERQEDKYLVSFFVSYLSGVNLRAGRLAQAIERAQAALSLRRELNLRLFATDDLATLAAAHLAAGDMPQALDYAQQSLTILDECHGEGPEFPQRDYFICYQALAAAGRIEPAQAALQSAFRLVMARANKINDPVLRQSFLEQVPVNHEILFAAQQKGR